MMSPLRAHAPRHDRQPAPRRRARLLAGGVLATLVSFGAGGAARAADPCKLGLDPLGHRANVSLFQYAGADSGDAKVHFSRFRGILRDKIVVLGEEIGPGRAEFQYLKGLALKPEGTEAYEDTLTESKAEHYWDDSRSLLLLRGNIFAENGGYHARSRLYLYGLHGSLPNVSVSMRLPIVDDAFPNTNDTHSLTLYYALAMDAARLECTPAMVIELLSKAEDKVRDLKLRGYGDPAVVGIETAVERAIEAQKQRAQSK
jgi:hypothetical protein